LWRIVPPAVTIRRHFDQGRLVTVPLDRRVVAGCAESPGEFVADRVASRQDPPTFA
jgi:hypothetical protein